MISIITITFNNFSELTQTLNSLKNINNIESIVINGGTCEETKNWLSSHDGKALSEPDFGISDAFNKGIKLATGDALMFLNSGDILLEPSYLDQVNNILKTNPQIDYFYSDIIYDDKDLGKTHIRFKNKKENLAKGMPYPHQTLIITKRVFEKIGGFDLNYKIAMDFDFILRMLNAGFTRKKHLQIAPVLMDGSGISSRNDLRSIDEITTILKKNGNLNLKYYIRLKLSRFLLLLKKSNTLSLLIKRCRHQLNF